MANLHFNKLKKTDVTWLPHIPEHWELIKVRHLFKESTKKGFPNEPLLVASQKHGVVSKDAYGKRTVEATKDLHNLKLVEVGDYVISLRSFQGGIELAYERGIISPAYTIMKETKLIDRRYFKNLFKSPPFISLMTLCVKGIREGQNIDYPTFKNEYLPVPPIEEQKVISEYLDKKNSEIDKFIRNKERLIKLLQEESNYKIESALFVGIGEHTETKLTSVNYLSKIPIHWDLYKIKHVAKLNPTKSPTKYTKNSLEEVVFLPMEKVTENGKISNEIKLPIKEVWTGYTYFARNDILMAKITPCFENGKGAFLNELETDIGFGTTEFHVLRVGKKVEPLYLYNILRSNKFRTLGKENMQGSAGQQRVPLDFVKNFQIGTPSTDEQIRIIEFINNINNKTALIISKAQQEIASIKEYREALITDLVTGKRSIPQ